MYFKDLALIEPLLRALQAEGYEKPTPIQEQAIPPVLKGHDLLGCAQTGTGKTAAFALPILQILQQQPLSNSDGNPIKTLILTPTRELAIQIGDSFNSYGKFTRIKSIIIFGGVSQNSQTQALKRGAAVVIATPGRLLDLMQQGFISLRNLDLFVLDEADRMLDMGFIHDVKKVISQLPQNRQTLFFSATMPPEIAGLADSILKNPVKVAVTPVSSTAEKIEQALYFVEKANKKLLLHHLLQDTTITSALVFSRTKHGANKIASDVNKAGIRAEAIHGNKSQNARQAALSGFKSGKLRVLVATDIAARGIDIDNLSHVINFDLPNIPETYVHRIGRTGRAGASGIAISFCDKEELPYLKDIEKLTGLRIPVMETHPFPTDLSAPPYLKQESQKFNAIIPSTLKGKQQPSAEVRQKPDRHSSKASLPPSYHQRKNEARNIGREENRDQALNRNANKNEDFNNNKRQNNNIIKQNNTIKQENNFQVPERKNRFASILEVAQLEKQPAFNKPKPTYKDRTGNNPANKENRGENAKDSNTRDRNRPRKYSK